ncbi:MAG: STAS domain-containing protein [Chitinispirillia bacterium]|jgi:anti-anti-sigma factor
MKLKLSSKGRYKIVTVYDPMKVISDLTELKKIIENFLRDGERFIAINFADASYLYSGAISVLILCYRMIRDQGGNLCILEPHKRILELLMQINIDSLIDICTNEDDLLNLNANDESSEKISHDNRPKCTREI